MRTLPPLNDAARLEHQVAFILTEQEIHGWTFNEQKAQQLESHLRREMEELTEVLRNQWTLCLLYTSPSPRDLSTSRMPSSA